MDKRGLTVDFRLSEHLDIEAAKEFFRKALLTSGAPMKVTLDGHYPSHRALFELRREARIWRRVKVRTCQYLNNIVEQDHRAIKARAGPMLGFKIFAIATLLKRAAETQSPSRRDPYCSTTSMLTFYQPSRGWLAGEARQQLLAIISLL